jgi:hypothetical protein
MGIVIAFLEQRDEDVEELLGIHAPTEDEDGKFDIVEMEAAARDLVNFSSWVALEAFSFRHPDGIAHEENPEHIAHTIEVLKGMALRMPLVDTGGDDDGS